MIEGAAEVAAALDHLDKAAAERTGEGKGAGGTEGDSGGGMKTDRRVPAPAASSAFDPDGDAVDGPATVWSEATVGPRTGTQSTPRSFNASRWAIVASSNRV